MLCSWFSPQDCVQTGRPGTRQNLWRMPPRPCSWLMTGWASRRSVCVVTYTWCLLLPAGLITLAFNTLTWLRRGLLLQTNRGGIYSAVIFTAEVKGRWQHLTQAALCLPDCPRFLFYALFVLKPMQPCQFTNWNTETFSRGLRNRWCFFWKVIRDVLPWLFFLGVF